jgi:hypothetical protein
MPAGTCIQPSCPHNQPCKVIFYFDSQWRKSNLANGIICRLPEDTGNAVLQKLGALIQIA